MNIEQNIEQRALNYLLATSEIVDSGCREWLGPRTGDGYGQIGVEWIVREWGIKGAHRLMVRLVHGHEFAGRHEQVMHLCHNRCCVNPDHLQVGTAKENIAAAKARGSLFGRRHLDEQGVLMIRALRSLKAAALWVGETFGITRSQVYKIEHGKSWSDTDYESEESRKEMEAAARAMIAEAQDLGAVIAPKAVA